MTLHRPTIILKRLCIFKDSRPVFDASFHAGLNIIRGRNSSGKSTILDFIAYTLGAENLPWKQEALLCDWSMAEVALNGKPVTFKRPVNENPLNPMYIYWGAFNSAVEAAATDWEVYGFRRSASRISFTQAILLALDLAEAQGEGSSNITMHQILRVLYADQPSLHSPIFRSDDAFDSALTRETVGSYLAGVYDDKLYSAQLKKRELEKAVEQISTELKSIFTVLATSERSANLDSLAQELRHLESERERVLVGLQRLRDERATPSLDEEGQGGGKLRSELSTAKRAFVSVQDSLASAELALEDSRKFVNEIEVRLNSLDDSSSARNYFGQLAFAFCPCCLAEIVPPANESECALCKRPMSSSMADAQVLRMRNELRIQKRESEGLIAVKESEVRDLRRDLPLLKRVLMTLERRYEESVQVWSSPLEAAIEEAARRIGSLEQEIETLHANLRLADAIRDRQLRREAHLAELADAESLIESLIYSQEARKRQVQLEVATTLARLLRQDLHRQEEFRKAVSVQFSFADNSVSVDGVTNFSESSTVVLRHLFHLALLSVSTKLPEMRFPRFLILDGIEDGGMELERSHRLQEIIWEECRSFQAEYQLIFATSQISPILDREELVVARAFSEESRSLAIRG